MSSNHIQEYKIAVLGDAAVGKTTLVRAFIDDTTQQLGKYRPTLGTDIRRQKVDVFTKEGSSRVSLTIWDLSGQPTFRSLVTDALTGASGAILVYEIEKYESFQAIAHWFEFLWKAHPASTEKPVVIVGNKKDSRRRNKGKVTPGQGRDYAKLISNHTGFETPFHEVSAIEKDNVTAPFRDLARLLLQKEKGVIKKT